MQQQRRAARRARPQCNTVLPAQCHNFLRYFELVREQGVCSLRYFKNKGALLEACSLAAVLCMSIFASKI